MGLLDEHLGCERRVGHTRIVRGNRVPARAADIEPEQLAQQRLLVLTVGVAVVRPSAVARSGPQHAVGPELELAAVVIVIHRMRNLQNRVGARLVGAVGIARDGVAHDADIARRIGEVEFNALFHQGNGSHIFMNSVDDDTIMITLFGKRTTVGLVRFYAGQAGQNLANLLKGLRGKEHVFEFTAADISEAPVFADH